MEFRDGRIFSNRPMVLTSRPLNPGRITKGTNLTVIVVERRDWDEMDSQEMNTKISFVKRLISG